jgi:hypothetical protein
MGQERADSASRSRSGGGDDDVRRRRSYDGRTCVSGWIDLPSWRGRHAVTHKQGERASSHFLRGDLLLTCESLAAAWEEEDEPDCLRIPPPQALVPGLRRNVLTLRRTLDHS